MVLQNYNAVIRNVLFFHVAYSVIILCQGKGHPMTSLCRHRGEAVL
jgi:hypothetical protein